MMRIATRRVIITSKPRGFLPTDIAGLQLWLRADAGLYKDAAKTQPATADLDVVGAWADQSGNGFDATQATTGKKPLLKTAVVNGKPVVRGDGVDDALNNTTSGIFTSTMTLFVVVRNISGQGNYLSSNTGAGDKRNHFYGGTTFIRWSLGPSASLAFTETAIISYYCAGSNEQMWKNGVSVGTSNSTPALSISTLGLFNNVYGFFKNCDLVEVLLYNSQLSDVNRQSVENYLNGKYNVY